MKLGFLTAGTVEDVVFAAKQGFQCVELALFGDTPLYQDSKEFARALDSEGIQLAAVSLFGQNYRDPDEAQRRKFLDTWSKAVDLGERLGAPIFITGSGLDPDRAPGDQYDEVVDALGDRIADVQARGMAFAFYNCPWVNVVTGPEAWNAVLPQLPKVGIKFDPSHPVHEGRDWAVELVAGTEHLLHAHAKDVLYVGGQMMPDPNPGLGQIAWGQMFALLYNGNYDGAVCIEPHSGLYTGEKRHAFLILSKRYLSQFMVDLIAD